MLVDTHCHLSFPDLVKDLAGVLSRARAAGVERMVNIGTRAKEFDALRDVTERHNDVFCTFGVHPEHVGEEGENIPVDAIIKLTEASKVIGIGETGLDYFYDAVPRERQKEAFARHIRAAKATQLPLIIHSRDAEEDTLRVLDAESGGNIRGVLHCFSSRRFLAEEGLKRGLHISMSGILTFKKSDELRAIVRDIPMDRLLVETDAPFLAPVPYRGKPCEPAYVVETAKVLADIKGVSFEEIAARTTENFYTLFSKCPRILS